MLNVALRGDCKAPKDEAGCASAEDEDIRGRPKDALCGLRYISVQGEIVVVPEGEP